MTDREPVLAQRLCRQILRYTKAIGQFGCGFEARLGEQPERILDYSPEQLLIEVQQDREASDALQGTKDELALRLAALFLDRMTDLARQRRFKRRPDALRLAAQLAANPEYPHSYAITRYCVALMLRSVYGLEYSATEVGKLREAYEGLRSRFAQQLARRELKTASPHDRYLLDILCLDEHVERTFSKPESYWSAHARHVLGIGSNRIREYPKGAPQLEGELPDFATLMNGLWAQPTGIEGLDEVLGGLLPAMPGTDEAFPGGLVTLVCGPPGSGKTTFCMTLASRMAELGSTVRYVATEEPAPSLRGRREAALEPRLAQVWPELEISEGDRLADLEFVDGSSFERLESVVETLQRELPPVMESPGKETSQAQLSIAPAFRRVVVIDSLTALMERGPLHRPPEDDPSPEATSEPPWESRRRQLTRHLEELRNLGVCVFLVGGEHEPDDDSLGYLVDNILLLGFEDEPTKRHPLRTLYVSKTRYQASRRGRHVLHLSRHRGCTVSPSLHAVLGLAKTRPWVMPDQGACAHLSAEGPALRRYSQTLIYGRGSAGKAGFALTLAMEPRRRQTSVEAAHAERLDRETRVLVISFLYEAQYYRELVGWILKRRFRLDNKEADAMTERTVDVMPLYPGYVDPETLVAKVRLRMERAQLEGRPFTAVVVDGVHNLLLQFPLLYPEPLVWPTLYRLFRGERMDVITTFTFFRVGSLEEPKETLRRPDYISAAAGSARPGASNVGASAELFFHMLVSSCDYTLLMERSEEEQPKRRRDHVELRFMTSVDGFAGSARRFSWDPRGFQLEGHTSR